MARKNIELTSGDSWFSQTSNIFWLLIAFTISVFGIGIFLENELAFLLPFALVVGAITVYNFHNIFYGFFALLPFSIEIYFSNGMGTDLPTEPIMLLLTGVLILKLITDFHNLDVKKWLHPIALVLLAHLIWIYFISLYSVNSMVSIKYALAKSWYVLPFFFLSLIVFKEQTNQRISNTLKVLWWSLFVALVYVMIRHASEGFSFASINDALKPIFRNHVNYAGLLVAVFPFMFYLLRTSKRKWLYGAGLLVLLAAIYLSYTRAAHLCVFLAFVAYLIIKLRLMKFALIGAALGAVVLVLFLLHDNKYLDYAPNYQSTVAHYDFDNLMEATTKLEDISTMERVHRWVAGFHMVAERPLTGFGPGCFYPTYQDFTLNKFKTYVSDNPEKSGMHNNYLTVFVEQGVIGFLIMILMIVIPLLYGEQYYHNAADTNDKSLIMAATVSIALIAAILIINELLEADKVGPIYFLALAIIVSKANPSKKLTE